MSDVVADLIRAALDVVDYTSELESHPHSASVFVRRDRALRKAAETYRTAQPPAQAPGAEVVAYRRGWNDAVNSMPAQAEPSPDTERSLFGTVADAFDTGCDIEPRQEQPTSEDVRAALLFALWHHQCGSSLIGQPIRRALGIGQHEPLSAEQCDIARRVQSALSGDTEQQRRDAAKKAYKRMTNNMVIIDDLVAYYLHSLDMKAFDEYFDEAAIEAEGKA